MEKYVFASEQRMLLERMHIPFAVYQFVNQRIETILMSDGFCELFGYASRDEISLDMQRDMYVHTHPDDISRMEEAAYRFATEDRDFDIIYRYRKNASEYIIIHAKGKHVAAETGDRLAYIWYTEEGTYNEQAGMKGSQLNQAMTKALHEESLIRSVYYDELTGLPSMGRFFELAEAGMESMLANNEEPVILYMDMSGLKYYNQKYGFNEGNNLLRAFAKILSRTFTKENCSRFGQDHFAVFTKSDDIENVLKKLFEEWEGTDGGRSLPVRVGIYKNSMEEVDISTACDRAKQACDEMKGVYASGVRYYSFKMQTETELKGYILANIDRALKEEWIQVYYQPIIRAVSGKVCNEEALSRWIDPLRGFMSPAEFIPVLEESRLIFKLDLYVVEHVIKKLQFLEENGFNTVPHSVNLSRSDFRTCDIVEEVRKRVDASGIGRDMIHIEITESTIGSDFEFMKEQIDRFRELGFQIWIDDFGSGYSSLNVLQSIKFDQIKFDMHFLRQLDESDAAKVILYELMKMATSLGVDTVCEGVETEEQIMFLQEIGCSKLQGFYYGRPIPLQDILTLHENKKEIGNEDPEESGYFDTVGSVNMHDLSIMESDAELKNLFNVFPMAVLERRGDVIRYARSNRAYRHFMKSMFDLDLPPDMGDFYPAPTLGSKAFLAAIDKCCREEKRTILNETLPDGTSVHSLFRKICSNPVNGTEAIGIAVLSITDAEQQNTYASLVRALSAEYYNLFYVNLDTEEFLEYSSPAGEEELSMEQRGTDFFTIGRADAQKRLYPDDRDDFLGKFTKENIVRSLDKEGNFSLTYRLTDGGAPFYVNMTVVRNHPGGHHIIIGVRNVDAHMRQQEALENIRRDQVASSRLMALEGDYLGIYTVNPVTDRYYRYSSTNVYDRLNLAVEGENFFEEAQTDARDRVFEEDLPRVLESINKEKVLEEIREKGSFELHYRLMIGGDIVPVRLRAAMVKENDGETLIVGVSRSR